MEFNGKSTKWLIGKIKTQRQMLAAARKKIQGLLNREVDQIKQTAQKNRILQAENAELRWEVQRLFRYSPDAMKMCGNKKSFRTAVLAEAMVDKFKAGRIYKCPVCHCWHHTTKMERAPNDHK